MRSSTSSTQSAAADDQSGLWFMVQAAFWFAVMALLVKLCHARGMPTMQIVLARALVTLALSSLMLWRARLRPFGSRTGLLLLRGLFGSVGLMCFYGAVSNLPLAEATVLHQLSPVLTAMVAALWLGERLEARVLAGMAIALTGVVMIAQPDALFGAARADDIDWRFVVVGTIGAVFASLAYVTVRQLGRTEPAQLVVFYFPIVTVPMSLPFALQEWLWPDALGWVLLLAVGIVTQIAQVALTRGLAREPAGRAISVGYLQVAFSLMFGAVFFGDLPGIWSWCGMILIVASLFVARRGSR